MRPDHSLKGQADKSVAFLLTFLLSIPWFGDNVEQRELSALSRPALIYKVTMSRLDTFFIFSTFQKLDILAQRNIASRQLEFFSSTLFPLCFLLTIIMLSHHVDLDIQLGMYGLDSHWRAKLDHHRTGLNPSFLLSFCKDRANVRINPMQ